MASTTNIVNTLGAGSGIDIKSLAESLVEAERAPRKQRIDDKIAKSEAKISGYGAVKYALSTLKSAFEKINDASDFSSITAKASQSSAFSATASALAKGGTFNVQVDHLAKAQRSESVKFAARNTPLNGGATFDLNLTVSGQAIDPISVTSMTPAGIASAINGAKVGVTAQLIDTGSGFQLVMTGQEGLANSFSITGSAHIPTANVPSVTSVSNDNLQVSADSDASAVVVSYIPDGETEATQISLEKVDGLWVLPSGQSIPLDATLTLEGQRPLTFGTNQSAQNSQISINGLTVVRPSNRINDVIDGVTLDLYAPTVNEARLDLTRDTTDIKQSIQNLVVAYNDFQDSIKILGDRKSEIEEFGGALAGDNLLNAIQSQVRSLLTTASTTPGETVKAARHVGLSIDRLGVLKLDEGKLDASLQDHFEEVVNMFSAGTNNKSVFSDVPAGLAGRAVKTLDEMMRSTGLLTQQTNTAKSKIESYKAELSKLEERMEKLLTRYTNQFSVMESIVGESTSMRSSLKSSFAAMLSSNSN
jgi:flagellar hook-associated protein 2